MLQIRRVGDAEIMKRAEQLAIDGIGQADLRGGVPAEIAEDIAAVGALRCCGEAEQRLWAEVVEQAPVGGRFGVVELIHHQISEVVGGEARPEFAGMEALDGHEEMIILLRSGIAHVQVAEIHVAQHHAEGGQALLEDFLAVGNEEQARIGAAHSGGEVAIIERADHRFAGAGGGDDEMLRAPGIALVGDAVENFLLEGKRAQIEDRQGGFYVIGAARFAQGIFQLLLIAIQIGGKLAVVPVRFIRGGELLPQVRRLILADFHVPFQPFRQRGVGHVGRANIGGAEAGAAMEDECLGMQAGAVAIIGDANLGIGQRAQKLHRFGIGGAHVAGGDDAEAMVGVVARRPATHPSGSAIRSI